MGVFDNKYLKPFKNIYLLVFILFAIWMLFFDAHSLLFHYELNEDIEALEYQKEHYKNEQSEWLKGVSINN